ncbi:hypothetical protein NL529_33520, partial [Klebsiella pneumoniae]|nr:hypothetical protein [Klebsiella pneumoniae]
MQPYLQAGQRYGFTDLDYAVMHDIGWTISPPVATSPPPASPPPPAVPPTTDHFDVSPPVNLELSSPPFTLSGAP